MFFAGDATFYRPGTVPDALAALHEYGARGQAIAGGTWVMRAGLRGESPDRAWVSLSGLADLQQLRVSAPEIDIGASVTHTALARALRSDPRCRALAEAAGGSANPAIRNVATVGGNLCAADFAAADLVPALMALNAMVELEDSRGRERISLARFMALRTALEPGRLVRRVIVPLADAAGFATAHVRLPLRHAGDYPVAIVSMAVTLGRDQTVTQACVAVGSVEPAARRWPRLEAALVGRRLTPEAAIRQAEAAAGDFVGRDSVEAPGWYRTRVLPTLVGRAVERLLAP
jgi:aerobic carbon-monoxide dehydrogenase medium subunit